MRAVVGAVLRKLRNKVEGWSNVSVSLFLSKSRSSVVFLIKCSVSRCPDSQKADPAFGKFIPLKKKMVPKRIRRRFQSLARRSNRSDQRTSIVQKTDLHFCQFKGFRERVSTTFTGLRVQGYRFYQILRFFCSRANLTRFHSIYPLNPR
jgi:hypothetical protein